ncbi:ArsJ-associated glyceraldehyde-3-phosphate dehydrogenase [Sneathiella marina]|uniref:Glyceraldehyde-3-phosphate dehydrogenase n=1 Tax=Sneathiella marina TaxID=2950108 RepID=A0ABY4W1M1_9PROT|nr:ArsJ-associated glyceraldehyde-3-phosphate dehydrogenase [Sneathiella marina]USG60751.1 ArsJ-associated glyceraldehyde-3-phosphate dehydrogenase [Sneathiella marina]
MTIRVGLNGFGRMGRLFLRAALQESLSATAGRSFEVVHINEVKGGPETAAHLLEFDSVHGRFPIPVLIGPDFIQVDDRKISFSQWENPLDVPWTQKNVDIVVECTGKFKSRVVLEPYCSGSVKKVIVAAPVKDADLNIVMGVNDNLYDPDIHKIITAASCTTNCLAPLVKVVHEAIGIRHGLITTIHDVTNTQVVVDAPHKDLRRARSALNSLIPTSTGSATAITMIYPELAGKLNGMAVRVPLLNASLTDCVLEMTRPTSVSEINGLFETASKGNLAGILGYETRPLVSADFVNDTRSSIVDALSTLVVDETQVKLIAWYDNEMGYVCRMVELAAKVAAGLE